MSYYLVKQPGTVYEAAAGMGAYVRQRRSTDKTPSTFRTSRPGRWARPPAGRAFRGMGAFDFNAASVWSAMQTCNTAWQSSQTTVPQCKTWTNAVRGALGTLGYGALPMGGSWLAADIAAYKAWCRANSIAEGTYPTQSALQVMETQLAQGITTGGSTPVEYTETPSGDLVPAADVTKAAVAVEGKKGFNVAALAIGAAALIGIAAIAIAAKRHGGSRTTVVTGSLPSTVAAKA